jgi:hypothetical protein
MTYKRKTVDEYEIQGNYGQGWECLTAEETHKAAREQLRCYNENEPGAPHRIVKRRIRMEGVKVMEKFLEHCEVLHD